MTNVYKILVAEDNEITRLVIKKILTNVDYQIEFAENGKMVLDKLREHEYDIILMDLNMPDIGGIDATKRIREMSGDYYKNVPIIALTASIMGSDLDDLKKAGMNDYILKPFNPEALYNKINLYLGGNK